MASAIPCQAPNYGKIHRVSDQYAVDPAKLRALRLTRTWSMKRLAKEAGVDYSTYWRIEQGQALNPRVETIQRLARALDVPVERLIAAEPTPAAREADLAAQDHAEGFPARLLGSGTLPGQAAALSHPDAARPAALLLGPLGEIEGLGDLSPEEEASVRAAMAAIRARRAGRGETGAHGGRAGGGGED